MAPLPNHETVLSGDPSNGLADYFSRSADEVSEYEDRLGILSLGARNELPPPPPLKVGELTGVWTSGEPGCRYGSYVHSDLL